MLTDNFDLIQPIGKNNFNSIERSATRTTYVVLTNLLGIIYKHLIRVITDSPYLAHSKPLLQKWNFLKLKDFVKLEIVQTIFF